MANQRAKKRPWTLWAIAWCFAILGMLGAMGIVFCGGAQRWQVSILILGWPIAFGLIRFNPGWHFWAVKATVGLQVACVIMAYFSFQIARTMSEVVYDQPVILIGVPAALLFVFVGMFAVRAELKRSPIQRLFHPADESTMAASQSRVGTGCFVLLLAIPLCVSIFSVSNLEMQHSFFRRIGGNFAYDLQRGHPILFKVVLPEKTIYLVESFDIEPSLRVFPTPHPHAPLGLNALRGDGIGPVHRTRRAYVAVSENLVPSSITSAQDVLVCHVKTTSDGQFSPLILNILVTGEGAYNGSRQRYDMSIRRSFGRGRWNPSDHRFGITVAQLMPKLTLGGALHRHGAWGRMMRIENRWRPRMRILFQEFVDTCTSYELELRGYAATRDWNPSEKTIFLAAMASKARAASQRKDYALAEHYYREGLAVGHVPETRAVQPADATSKSVAESQKMNRIYRRTRLEILQEYHQLLKRISQPHAKERALVIERRVKSEKKTLEESS